MKKILFSLSILSILFITSCGKDDGGIAIGLSGSITYEGESISMTDGLFGEISQDGQYAATFFLSDAPLSYDESDDNTSFEGDILISLIIASTGDSFQAGSYPVEFTSSKGVIAIVATIAGSGDQQTVVTNTATGGSVNITGSGNSYNLTFNLDFENDIKLTGNATGGFEIIDISSAQ